MMAGMSTPKPVCASCGNSHATWHLAHLEAGKLIHERHLCHDCAAKERELRELAGPPTPAFEVHLSLLKDIEKLLVAMKKNCALELRVVADTRPSFNIRGTWHDVGNRPLQDAEVRRMFGEIDPADAFAPGRETRVVCTVPDHGDFLVRASLVDGKPGFTAVPAP